MKTNAVRIRDYGGPDKLNFERVDYAKPGEGEVTLRQTAVGVNFIDTYHRNGLYEVERLPSGIGMEAAGIVESVGPGVEFEEGQRVAYANAGAPGAYAERRTVPADRLVALPDEIDDETAAAVMLKGMTVEYLVRRTFPVEEGMTVLFHAAAGGVGSIACQWLSHLGAVVIGTVSTEEKAERARANGCDHPIVYTAEDFVSRVAGLTDGEGVDVAYDGVGKSTFIDSLHCVRKRGMLVSFGNASGPAPAIDPLELSRNGSLFLTRPSLFDYVSTREELEESSSALFEVIASGALEIPIGQRWPLSEAAEAHRALEARETVGATVLIPEVT